jgi:Ca2+-binding EF-hand superfamily protein
MSETQFRQSSCFEFSLKPYVAVPFWFVGVIIGGVVDVRGANRHAGAGRAIVFQAANVPVRNRVKGYLLMRVAFAVVLILTAGGLAARSQTQEKPPATPVLTVLQLDANGDQTLERDEIPESGHAAFNRLLKLGDVNKNGKLESEEIRTLIDKLRAWQGAGAARFQAMDKNGDGKLAPDEFEGPRPLFAQIDTDKDGFLTPEEIKAFALSGGAAAPGRLKAMDQDGDGKISRTEFFGRPELFARLDADGDGLITTDEAAKFHAGNSAKSAPIPKPDGEPTQKKARPAARLKTMDRDGDGKVSGAEFTGPPRLFDRLDVNKDGFLSAEDLLDRGAAGPKGKNNTDVDPHKKR